MLQQNARYNSTTSQLPAGRTELQPTGIYVLQTSLLSSSLHQHGIFSTESLRYCIHFMFFP